MSRCFASLFVLVALAPATAFAQGDCPDGWFCDAPPASPPAATAPGAPPNAPPPAPGEGAGARPAPRPQLGEPPPPPYPPPPPLDEPIIVDQPETPPPFHPRRHRDFHEWGFNLHLEAALMGDRHARDPNSDMAGLGFALRYRPLPPLAFEAGLDLLGGNDYQGYSRGEVALLANVLVFFNPHDVVQIYGLAGFGISGANVTVSPRAGEAPFPHHDEHYSYAGGQAGMGVEVRVSRRLAMGGDILGFVRGRTDDKADISPEFVDPDTHRATNTSGGGLIRVGATFYW